MKAIVSTVEETYKIEMDKILSCQLPCIHLQVLEIVYRQVSLTAGVDLRNKVRDGAYVFGRHSFIYLSDYFINTIDLRSGISKYVLLKVTKPCKHHKEIANVISTTKQYITHSLLTSNNLLVTDKKYAKDIEQLKHECYREFFELFKA